jgi:hypothetical protein
MANGDLEQRVAALEAQGGGGGGGGGGEEAQVQAFLQGALTAYAASQSPQAQGLQAGGGAGGEQGLFGWKPTKYDSIFWCKSRFMCNPQSVSCLC